MPDKVTVLIPTRDRPGYLQDALNSVANQTAVDRIGEVIVSENGALDRSEIVCKAFDRLPIKYVKQSQSLPIHAHFQALAELVHYPFVAFLCDDDWWASDHLQSALNVLESAPSIVAVFSHFYETPGPSQFFTVAPRLRLFWIASGRNFSRPMLTLSQEEVLLGGLLMTCFHFSTLVGHSTPFRDAAQKIASSGNDYDFDRMVGLFLVSHGLLAFLTKPDTFIRAHNYQEGHRPDLLCQADEHLPVWIVRMNSTTRWLRERDPALMTRAADFFNKNLATLSDDEIRDVTRFIPTPIAKVFVDECGFKFPLVSSPIQRLSGPGMQQRRSLKWLLKQICPPALVAIKQRLIP